MDWFTLAIISFVCFGIQNYLYKVSAMREFDTRAVTLIYVVASTLTLWIVALSRTEPIRITPFILWLGVFDAVFYYATTISRIESLRFVPSNLAFPIARMSTFIVVCYAVLLRGEVFSWQLGLALLLLVLVLAALHSERHLDMGEWPDYKIGIVLSVISMFTSAGTNIISKLAAENGDLTLYMAAANSFVIVISFGDAARKKSLSRMTLTREAFLLGILIAIVNLLAWYSYLWALMGGPLAVVMTISSMAFIVPIILSTMFHEERLSFRRTLALALTATALIFLHSH